MPKVTFREAVFAAMHARLQDAFPELFGETAIVRNPMNEIGTDDPPLRLRCHDGEHANAGSAILGWSTYRMAWVVEGSVCAPESGDDGTLDTQVNDLQARIVEAIITHGTLIEVPLADGGFLEIEAADTEFNLARQGAVDSEVPAIRFTQGFALSVEVPTGTAFVTLA
jgi:hypothetical protein